jgi:hypothetical protein
VASIVISKFLRCTILVTISGKRFFQQNFNLKMTRIQRGVGSWLDAVGCSFPLLRRVCWPALEECYEFSHIIMTTVTMDNGLRGSEMSIDDCNPVDGRYSVHQFVTKSFINFHAVLHPISPSKSARTHSHKIRLVQGVWTLHSGRLSVCKLQKPRTGPKTHLTSHFKNKSI